MHIDAQYDTVSKLPARFANQGDQPPRLLWRAKTGVVLIALLLLRVTVSLAQAPCSDETVWKDKGTQTTGFGDFHLNTTERKAVLAKLEGQVKLLRQALSEPTGQKISVSRAAGLGYGDGIPGRPVGSEVTFFTDWQSCARAKDQLGPPEVHLVTNRLNDILTETPLEIGGHRVYRQSWDLGEFRGARLLDQPQGGAGGLVVMSHNYLFTPGGRIPWVPVAKGVVLDHFRIRLEDARAKSLKQSSASSPVRPMAAQLAAKQRRLDEIDRMFTGNARESRRRRFLEDWRSDEEMNAAGKARVVAMWDVKIARVDAVRAGLSPQELMEPATLHHSDQDPIGVTDRWDFTPPKTDRHICNRDCRHGLALVTLDPAFFAAKIPRTDARLLVLRLVWIAYEHKRARDTVNEQLLDRLRERIDFERIGALLGR